MKKFPLVLFLLLVSCIGACAAEKEKTPAEMLAPDLIKANRQLNKKAPPIKIGKILCGNKINLYSSKVVQVLVFCELSSENGKDLLPILDVIQKEYNRKAKVTALIPVRDESAFSLLLPNLEELSLGVAVDKEDGSLKEYRDAYGNFRNVPYAFIIKNGKTLWQGHPLHKMDDALKSILDGSYDIQAAIRQDQAKTLLEKYDEARLNGDFKYAKDVARVILSERINDADFLVEVGAVALDHKDAELADAAVALAIRAAKLDGDDTQAERLEKGLTSMRFAQDLANCVRSLSMGRADAAVRGDEFLEKYKSETELLLDAAPKVVFGSTNVKMQKFAEKMLDLIEEKIGKEHFKTVSLRAVLLYQSGKNEEGARLFKKSMETLTDPEDKRLAEEMFDTLENGKRE